MAEVPLAHFMWKTIASVITMRAWQAWVCLNWANATGRNMPLCADPKSLVP